MWGNQWWDLWQEFPDASSYVTWQSRKSLGLIVGFNLDALRIGCFVPLSWTNFCSCTVDTCTTCTVRLYVVVYIVVVYCSDMLVVWWIDSKLALQKTKTSCFISTLRLSHDLNASTFWQFIQVFLFMTLSARILFKIQCSLRNLMKVASPTLLLDMQTVVLEWLKYVAVCPFEPARCFWVVGEPPAHPSLQ